MKNIFILIFFCLFCSSCKKDDGLISSIKGQTLKTDTFTNYTINQGKQFCEQSTIFSAQYAELKFVVKFDSSAIYTTANPFNQYDINKLYGFSDNNSNHQKFSARFGWRWSDKALHIFAYVYNDGIRISKELGKAKIGDENIYSVKIFEQRYVFSLNEISDTLHRSSTTKVAVGYKLFPYFGGDEVAPHDINIKIKEL